MLLPCHLAAMEGLGSPCEQELLVRKMMMRKMMMGSLDLTAWGFAML